MILARALAWPGTTWGLFRSNRTRLSETILATLENQVFPAHGMMVPGKAGAVNRTSYDLPNGSRIIPIGLDDIQRSTSLELAGGYLAEAVELGNSDDALALAGCLRQTIPYPGGFHQLVVDTNPGPPGHWLNEIAEPVSDSLRLVRTREDYKRLQAHNRAPVRIPGRWKRIVARHQDNPAYFDTKAWEWTEQGKAYLATLQFLASHLKARWLDGLWKAATGNVFPEFGERNVCVPFPAGWPSSWPCWVFLDTGYDHPCGMGFYGLTPTGQPHIFDDFLRSGTNIAEQAAWIKEHRQGRNVRGYLADPRRVFAQSDLGDGQSIYDRFLKDHGIRFEPYPRKQGKEVQQQVEGLRLAIIDKDKPLQVWSNCTGTISNFQSWRFKRNAAGEMGEGDDAYEDKDNDIIDPLLGLTTMRLKYSAVEWSFG